MNNVTGVSTALDVWIKLESTYAAGSATQIRYLKSIVHHLAQNDETVEVHMA